MLRMIDVMNEHIERLHPLGEPLLQLRPLVRGNNARDDIEGNQAFSAGIVAIHREGNADPAKDQIGLNALARNRLGGLFRQPVFKFTIMRPHIARTFGIHFIKKARHERFTLKWFGLQVCDIQEMCQLGISGAA